MKGIKGFVLMLTMALCWVLVHSSPAQAEDQPTGDWEPAPLCFAQTPNYAYTDERLRIHIARIEEPGLVYFIADIQTNDPSALRTALSYDKKNGPQETTSDIAQRNSAVLATNGDDYSTHQSGIIIRNGELIRAKTTTRHLLTLDGLGNLAAYAEKPGAPPAEFAQGLLDNGVTQAWAFGPVLVQEGAAAVLSPGFALIAIDEILEPRTAIAQIGPLHYALIVVDGRREGYSGGVTLPQLQRLCLEIGAQTAFNLDGGGSTTLYFQGAVINRPASNAQRRVSDIVMFR